MRLVKLVALASILSLTVSSAMADANADFLRDNAKKPGVKLAAGGLQYKVLASGKGVKPRASDCVSVNYKGSFIDGRVFDQSKPGEPITFPVNRVIPGWTEALQMMHTGDRWELFIPSTLGYGATGTPGGPIPPGATLVFDVELLGVSPARMGQCPA
ncbi:MAG TPA: FKBP-type peptidyl-prolyl cis-trans isomerase [Rhizomicrobium sp.]|jgi:FKBP-type peptidyl-prolyl cis-trans isomerase|nr:FKBP-type peptidyl-prolyl cis-trans isomerase [Rhizomicrobium sp.]